VFLRNHFAGQWREFFAEGSTPSSDCEETSFVGEFLNGCEVFPAFEFVFWPVVTMMWREKDLYARGTGGPQYGNHILDAIDRLSDFLYQRP